MNLLAGLDIGGTKCAVVIGATDESGVHIIGKLSFPTPSEPEVALHRIMQKLDQLLAEQSASSLLSIGISCGGPLDSRAGLILSPPNLPNWDRIDVLTPLRQRFGVPVGLQNDANACALAEWRWGAGQGCDNMIFLTFGTGMGAGLILNGKLYSGTNDMAGEIGHIRMEKEGPVGYGKAGSFEGFCSGGGIARLARSMAESSLAAGAAPLFCPTVNDLEQITTSKVGAAAQQGDSLALEVFSIAGKQLGRGLAILVDILNPQKIVIGSIYGRQQSILEPIALTEMRKEALPQSLQVCEITPAGLHENVGDLASLSVALNILH
jgi:glucokinase